VVAKRCQDGVSLQIKNNVQHHNTKALPIIWARYTLLCCGFDSRRHTQILYKENRKMLFGAQKKRRKKKLFEPSFDPC
jgi:hypothetical protein